jgi:tripartite-type tricarboxylate transporter receptor subunit TctC
MFDNMTSSVEHVRGGRLRGLAVTTAARSEALPDLPIVGDFVRGYEASGIYGIGVPKDTPPDIVDKLNREINAALSDSKITASQPVHSQSGSPRSLLASSRRLAASSDRRSLLPGSCAARGGRALRLDLPR